MFENKQLQIFEAALKLEAIKTQNLYVFIETNHIANINFNKIIMIISQKVIPKKNNNNKKYIYNTNNEKKYKTNENNRNTSLERYPNVHRPTPKPPTTAR